MNVKIINKSKHQLPLYGTKGSAGVDLTANIENDIILEPWNRVLIKTGLFIELPDGYEAQVRPRSGLALKNGITVLNTPGTIDADYRGEIGVILINLSKDPFVIKDGDRIAQMVFNEIKQATWISVQELSDSDRGAGGFGSTGV